MAVRIALYLALPCLAENRALEAEAAAAVAAVAKHFLVGQGAGARRLQPPGGGDDTCHWARDGVCDHPPDCDYDTDCTDCGTCLREAPTVPDVRLDAECQKEVGPLVQTLMAPECQQEFANLALSNQNSLTNQNLEEVCTSSCFDTALEVLDHDCFAKAVDGGSRDTNLGLGFIVNVIRSMCVKNEHGDYCGTKLNIAQGQTSHSECSAYEDMGCCFTEVADIVSSVTQQQGQTIDLAAATKALCSDYDIETEKCRSAPLPEPSSGLSTGAIVGIVLGGVAGLALIGVLVFFLCIRKSAPGPAPRPTQRLQPGTLLGERDATKEVAWPQEP